MVFTTSTEINLRVGLINYNKVEQKITCKSETLTTVTILVATAMYIVVQNTPSTQQTKLM